MSTFSTTLRMAAVGAALLAAPAVEAATYTYVGSWQVYDPAAPVWTSAPPNGPLAYTAQEAAALLFGGVASDYAISTISDLVADIDFQGWYDVIGFGAAIFAQDYNNKYLGQYYGPTVGYNFGDINNAASAFVQDNFVTNLNYAFKVSDTAPIPLPAAFPMLALALAATGALAVRRRKTAD